MVYKWKQSGNFKNITEIERMENNLGLDMRERKPTRMGCLKQVFEKYVMALAKEELIKQPRPFQLPLYTFYKVSAIINNYQLRARK